MESSVQHILAGRPRQSQMSQTDRQAARYELSGRSLTNETEAKAKCASDRLADIVRVLANEPSLALFRIEEHVRKSVPRIAERRREVSRLSRDVRGHASDLEGAVSTLESISRSRSSFDAIHELAKNALFLKQQLDYERRRKTMASSVTDAIKRSSADVVSMLSSPRPARQQAEAPAPAEGASVLESAKTFLRSKTIDYSQNLMRRSQATKSVEIPAHLDFCDMPPPPAAADAEVAAQPRVQQQQPDASVKRSISAELLHPVAEETPKS